MTNLNILYTILVALQWCRIEKRKETVFIWILVVFRISFCSLKDKDEDFSGHQTFWPLVGTPQAIVTISGLRASPCLVINGMFLFSMKCKNSITFLSYYFIVRIWQIIQLYFVMKSTLHLHKIIKMWRAFIKRLIGFGALESVKNNLIWIDHYEYMNVGLNWSFKFAWKDCCNCRCRCR